MIAQPQSIGNTALTGSTIQLLITDPLLQTDEPNSGLILSKTFSSWDELFSYLLDLKLPIEQRGLHGIEHFEITAWGAA